jgi:toxin YoeB
MHGNYLYCQKTHKNKIKRLNELIRDCQRNKFEGIGKPEPLKENLAGFWSRRIDNEHRLVYKISDNRLHIIQCRFHY